MRPLGRRNGTTAVVLCGVATGMVGLSFAAVPLYNVFCRVTGLGGTTQVAASVDVPVVERTVRVRFVADTDRGLDWTFAPEAAEATLRLGEPMLAWYTAANHTATALAGTAVYNVTPAKAGPYFTKVECFCFGEQVLQAGEEAELPVYFYVDPAMAEDPGMDDVRTITLSYTFYRARSVALDDAVDAYYKSTLGESAPTAATASR
jgi:cytochrome c oxidase assembly protein subunit 11